MTLLPRRTPRRVAAVVHGAIVFLALLFVSLPTSADSPCQALLRWAQPYAGTSPTLANLAAFDSAHRRAIFTTVGAEVRANLWREHLVRFERQPGLSAEQRALIGEAIGLTTPALYRHDPTATREFDAFWARAERAFTSPDQQRPWYDLGSLAAPSRERVALTPIAAAAQEIWCNCRTASGNGQCFGTSCVSSYCTSWDGCGAGGSQPCNGMCQ